MARHLPTHQFGQQGSRITPVLGGHLSQPGSRSAVSPGPGLAAASDAGVPDSPQRQIAIEDVGFGLHGANDYPRIGDAVSLQGDSNAQPRCAA